MKASTKAMNDYVANFMQKYGYLYCEKCKRTDKHIDNPHHIIFRSERPKHEELHSHDNLILLCRDCHKYMHNHKHNEYRSKLIRERKLYELFGVVE